MKRAVTMMVLAWVMPLSAQQFEAGLLYTWSPGKQQSDFSSPNFVHLSPLQAQTWKAPGIRVGYRFAKAGPVAFQVNATAQAPDEELVSGDGMAFTPTKERYGYWAAGMAAIFDLGANISLGMEYRSETMRSSLSDYTGNYPERTSTTFGRPWARMGIDFDLPVSPVGVFVGLEGAVPLTSHTLTTAEVGGSSPDDTAAVNRSLAPRAQYGVHMGVRF